VIHKGASPTDSQSQATGGQVSLRAAGCRQAKHSERRKASDQSVVAAQIFRVADSASSGILCSVGGAARLQMVEGKAESTRCAPACTASCAAGGSRWGKLGSVGVEQQPKVEVRWLAMHQQILGKDFAVSTGTESAFETQVVRTVQPSRQHGHLKHRWWKGRPYPLPWRARLEEVGGEFARWAWKCFHSMLSW
jgi:hypothetical protein